MKDTIRQLTKRLGVSADTIRYYRELGLLHPHVRENGYHEYTVDDMLAILLIREMRSMDISLPAVKDFLERQSMNEYSQWLDLREEALLNGIKRLNLLLGRLHETKVYASCGVRLLNQVEEFDGPATWAVSSIGTERPYEKGQVLEKWVGHLPFTYVSATILLPDLQRCHGSEPYPVAIGMGALEKYVNEFSLPLPEYACFQPGGHFIRTCIPVPDILAVSPEDLKPLTQYAREKGYRFASCTGGRILFIEQKEKPLYYFLVWVRVDRDNAPSPA